MRLKQYAKLTATVRLKSGLHIGSGEEVERGEPLPVMKSLRTKLPYIPGSSFKGKMRHLLELKYRYQSSDVQAGDPCGCGECQICLLFGSSRTETTKEPTRLLFRDCDLTDSSTKLLEKIELEEKPGIKIDRKSGKVAGRALFSIERIPEGCEFNLELSIRIFDGDNKSAIKNWLAMGLYLIEQDALGGSGTRGSGYIEFDNIQFNGEKFEKDWRDMCKSLEDHLLDEKIKSVQQ